jgi:hypothetical protein
VIEMSGNAQASTSYVKATKITVSSADSLATISGIGTTLQMSAS